MDALRGADGAGTAADLPQRERVLPDPPSGPRDDGLRGVLVMSATVAEIRAALTGERIPWRAADGSVSRWTVLHGGEEHAESYTGCHICNVLARLPADGVIVTPDDGPFAQRLAIVRADHDRKHEAMGGISLGWCWRKGRGRAVPNTVKCDLGLVLATLGDAS